MACGNNMVSRAGLQSAPAKVSLPSLPGLLTPPPPSPQQVAAIRQQAQSAMAQAEQRAAAAVTAAAASEAVREAQRALDTARRMPGPARERAALVRDLERKLGQVKQAASAQGQEDHLGQVGGGGLAGRKENVRVSIAAIDRLGQMALGVIPAGNVRHAPSLAKRVGQAGGAGAVGQHAARSRAKEAQEEARIAANLPLLGHSYRQHVDIDSTGLRQRLHDSPHITHATRWTSDEAVVTVNALVWNHPGTQRVRAQKELEAGESSRLTFGMQVSLAELFGGKWRKHVDGFSRLPSGHYEATQWGDDGLAIVVYVLVQGVWYLDTCYPKPDGLA